MISKKEFFRLYNRNSPENKERNVADWAGKYYRRTLSLHIAYFLARRGVSANSVTLFNFVLALIFSTLFVIPSIFTIVLLIVIHEIVYILDNVDGQLARYHGTFSKFGGLLDELSDIFTASFFTVIFGFRLFIETTNPLFLILGSIGALSYVFEGLWIKSSDEIIGKYNEENSNTMMYKMRNYLLSINKVSIIVSIVLVLSVFERVFSYVYFVEIFFVLYIAEQFLTKIVLRYCLLFVKAERVKRSVWKGWSSA